MESIDAIRKLDDELFLEFTSYFEKTKASNYFKEFPVTFATATQFITSTNFVKNSILDCAENDDLFGVNILFRSLIEHYLRFTYVWINWIQTQSDDTCKRYLDFSKASEILNQIRTEINVHKMSNPSFQFDSWDKLLSEIPACKNLSRKEIEQEALKYTHKSIVRHLNSLLPETDLPFFGGIIREYSRLSSFVHGSIDSHFEMMKFKHGETRLAEYLRICMLSIQLAGTVKQFTLMMFLKTDQTDFERHYIKMAELVAKINQD